MVVVEGKNIDSRVDFWGFQVISLEFCKLRVSLTVFGEDCDLAEEVFQIHLEGLFVIRMKKDKLLVLA